MALKITSHHRPADLSSHQGMLLNNDFGFGRTAMPELSLDVADLDDLAGRVTRVERGYRVLRTALWVLTVAILLAAAVQ